ncbi:uncharacterized protein BDZ99DRAFT_401942 [Mytilinidion resinicola]|uniref:Zn(2)-C6 fungal-type domain-containing protein n=1 Tax=Mytilinidion resinicola TaxID=574789 RepID=A0A6A6Y0H7_9PEZI|nr:uncharacterized protein BDZ99DRAFT_401942 [Mytilinidion resinicola]KAF2802272.1 hypothetical protein BDZ99DRAFT_401942 [Mytilinidion resinicola]
MSERAATNCHNCRRRRVKCDRLLPQCQKCSDAGLECMGYGRLILWNRGVASRGKMMGKTFDEAPVGGMNGVRAMEMHSATSQAMASANKTQEPFQSAWELNFSLVDPLLQDLDHTSRRYISHFASHVAQDMVIYDLPEQNTFHSLLKYIGSYPMLRNMVIATSAYLLSNRFRPDTRPPTLYNDALTAKHRAIGMLRPALQNIETMDVNIVLASITLFILFELIDSGKNTWKIHVEGAKMLLLHYNSQDIYESVSTPLGNGAVNSGLISECIVFDIIGSTLSGTRSKSLDYESRGLNPRPFVEFAEMNNCFSFPAKLLELILDTSRLADRDRTCNANVEIEATALMESARSFNPLIWAARLRSQSPYNDIEQRVLVASALKAAVRLFIWRSLFSDIPNGLSTASRHALLSEIIHHLAQIDTRSPLFKATAWPCFIAGAETDDAGEQSWVVDRLRCYYNLMPWNYIISMIEVLGFIWSLKTQSSAENPQIDLNWLQAIKERGIDHFVA